MDGSAPGPLAAAPSLSPGPAATAPALPAGAGRDDNEIALQVLDHLQRQIDLLLERRLREALAPAVARLVETLVQEASGELAATLRELAAQAVARELSRRHAG